MKRRIAVMLVLSMIVFALAGCGGGKDSGKETTKSESNGAESKAETKAETQAAQETLAETKAEENQAGGWSVATETDKVGYEELVSSLGELKPEDVPEGLKIGVVLSEPTNEFWVNIATGIKKAADYYGVEVDVQHCSSAEDITGQLAIAETMVNQNYDIYVMTSLADDTLASAVDMAHANGKKVVNCVSQVLSNADVYFGYDQYDMGVTAAEYVIEKLGAESGKVAIVMGAVGTEVNTQRVNGFKETCEAAGLEVVAELPAEWDVEAAMNLASDALTTDPDIKAFFCVNDNMAISVAEAVNSKGLQGEVTVIGVDGISATYESMAEGGQTATVDSYAVESGERSLEMAIRLLLEQDVNRCVIGPLVVIDQNNRAEYGK